MANTAGATVHKTPPRGGDVASASELKSTPTACGTASMSENVGAVGVNIKNLWPWISRDVEIHRTCEIDTMLQELLYRCRDTTLPDPDKSALLQECLKLVLPLCNKGKPAKVIKEYLVDFAKATVENKSYSPFVGAVNTALLELRKLNPAGILPSKGHDDPDAMLFHHNDKEMYQGHQGEISMRKPDVVVVPLQAARDVQKHGDLNNPLETYAIGREKPFGNFQWKDIRSTVEFKRSKTRINPPPASYELTDYKPPKEKYVEYRKGMDASGALGGSVLAPAATSAPPQTSSSVAPRRSTRKKAGQNKRTADHLDSNEPSSKRSKSNNENRDPDEPPKQHPIVQNGLYVAEMFAAHFVRQHVISCIVKNDIIYVWYFDRQDAIQCSGFNFIQDLPRFMVLLLIMQRMRDVEWGLNRLFVEAMKPTKATKATKGTKATKAAKATEATNPSSRPTIQVKDNSADDLGMVDLEIDLEAEERMTHYGLRGRATNVFPVKSATLSKLLEKRPSQNVSKEMVAKLYWPEQSRESEPDILKKVQKIAEKYPKEVGPHIPEMVWFHKFDETSTADIRKTLGIDEPERGSRVLYIIVFRKLVPITTLSGKDFLRAWWQVVVCHRILWQEGIHHRDISPSNIMVYQTADGQWIGVLNDYDLSSTQEDGPSGNERTGTIPFMAIDLLEEEAMKGKVEHLYRHDVESFIWVLVWVCLRYDDGKLRSERPLNAWLKEDANGCREKKNDFINSGRHKARPSPSHMSNWAIGQGCLRQIGLFHMDPPAPIPDHEVYQKWLQAHVPPSIQQ